MVLQARIIGSSSYLPDQVLTNFDLEKMVDTSDEWIVSRTGMKERRIAAKDESTSDMGAKAALNVLQQTQIPASKVDLILVVTMTPDYISPSTAALIQAKIGATQAAAVDLQAACSGYLYGLSVAKAYIESGLYQTVLLVASEKMSAFMDYQDRNTCVLFGDGAGACLITPKGSGLAIGHVSLGADGCLSDLIMIPAGGAKNPATLETVQNGAHFFRMQGKEVFKHAVRRMASAARECMKKQGIEEKEISWLIPHQANIRILEALSKQFSIPSERVYKTIHKYGNTSGSSVAIALEELTRLHTISLGEHLLLVVFGGGLTWGATILTQIDEEE